MLDVDIFDWSSIEGKPTDAPIIAGAIKVHCTWPGCDAEYLARSDGRNKFCPKHSSKKAARDAAVKSRKFRVFDGEETDPVNHTYGLIGLGDEQKTWDYTPAWYEVMSWLYKLNDARFINIAFHMQYDESQIFKSLLPHDAYRLLVEKRSRPSDNPWWFPVETQAPDGSWWLIDISHRGRLLRFKPRCDCPAPPAECKKHGKEHDWMYIADVGQYFSGSLTDVLDDDPTLGTPTEREIVYRGKANRGQTVPLDDLEFYNRIENKLVAEAMERVRAALALIGIYPALYEWYGIGKAGQYLMDDWGSITPRTKSRLPVELISASKTSYFGPWFENIAHGYVAGETHEYDLNGAFAAILAAMPCMEHGWTHGYGDPGSAAPGHIRQLKVKLEGTQYARLGPALFREEDGRVHSPYKSAGWHWDFELEARKRLGLISSMEVLEWWDAAPCDCDNPCSRITELYDLRQKFPKGSVEHNLFKKLPDTVYGKFAESGPHSKYGNPVYASYVTARCRQQVLDMIRQHQDSVSGVLMITSDGFLTRNPFKCPERLPIDTGLLGDWKHKAHHNVFIFEPGLWWSDETVKTSGIRIDDFDYFRRHVEGIFRSWRDGPVNNEYPDFDIALSFRVITLREVVNIRGLIPQDEPWHSQCMKCPACAGEDTANATTYKEFQRSGVTARIFGRCPMCGAAALLEMDHCNRLGHGFCRDRICHYCNMDLAEAEVMMSWDRAGEVTTDSTQRRQFKPGFKRDDEFMGIMFNDANQAFMSFPKAEGVRPESAPYNKDMGWSEDEIEAILGNSQDGSNVVYVRRRLG